MSTPPGVKFVYLFCDDLQAMRHFYTEILGLHEIYYAEHPDRTVAYDCDELQFTIIFDPKAEPVTQGWAWQPGWREGMQPTISWSVCLTKDGYSSAIKKFKAHSVESYYQNPQWLNYWSYPVKDPMGNTVEIVLNLDQEPENTVWQ